AYISFASKTLRFALVFMLVVIHWSPLFFGRFRTFGELGVIERGRHLQRMEKSFRPLPLLVVAYKTMLTMLFYEAETELREIGYPGPDRQRWKRGLPVAREGP